MYIAKMHLICNANESKNFFLVAKSWYNISVFSAYPGSKFIGTFASFTFLTTVALTAPHHSESVAVTINSRELFYRYLVIKL